MEICLLIIIFTNFAIWDVPQQRNQTRGIYQKFLLWDYWQIQEPKIWVIWNFFTKWSSIMVFIVLRWDVMYLFWNLWRKYHILFFNIRIRFHNLGHIFLIQCYFASTYFINIMIIHFIIIDKQYYELWQFLCWHHNRVGKRSNQPKPLCMATIYKKQGRCTCIFRSLMLRNQCQGWWSDIYRKWQSQTIGPIQ